MGGGSSQQGRRFNNDMMNAEEENWVATDAVGYCVRYRQVSLLVVRSSQVVTKENMLRHTLGSNR
jgi:hypothetical protein